VSRHRVIEHLVLDGDHLPTPLGLPRRVPQALELRLAHEIEAVGERFDDDSGRACDALLQLRAGLVSVRASAETQTRPTALSCTRALAIDRRLNVAWYP